MELKKIDSAGVKLAYAEKNPFQKHILFFINSNSSSLLWRYQFKSNLFDEYRLISIELPGHGQSDRSINPAFDFSIRGSAFLLSEAIKQLAANNPYTLIGFSYGTNLVAEMLGYGLVPKGIVLVSSSITGTNFEIDKIIKYGVSNIYLKEDCSLDEIEKFYATHLLNSTPDDQQIFIRDFLAVQPLFRSTVLESVALGNYSDEIELLNTLPVPLLLIWGEIDGLLNQEYLNVAPLNLWHKQSYTIPQSGHFVITDQPVLFNQLLQRYVRSLNN